MLKVGLLVFNAIFSCIIEVSFIDRGNRSKFCVQREEYQPVAWH